MPGLLLEGGIGQDANALSEVVTLS